MGFPVPGDAIEESLDLNHHLVHNPAATFFMKVEGDAVTDAAVGSVATITSEYKIVLSCLRLTQQFRRFHG